MLLPLRKAPFARPCPAAASRPTVARMHPQAVIKNEAKITRIIALNHTPVCHVTNSHHKIVVGAECAWRVGIETVGRAGSTKLEWMSSLIGVQHDLISSAAFNSGVQFSVLR